MTQLIIDIEQDVDDYGAAMLALSERARAFVVALTIAGGDQEKAALAAGYGSESATPQQAKVAAHMAGYRLMRDKRVLAAIKEEAERRLHSGALLGASVLIAMANDPMSKHRFKAAVELLDRAGLAVTTRHEIAVTHETKTDKQQIETIIRQAKQLGLDPRKLLGNVGVVLDAEFEVIEGSADGLEDLL